MNWSKYALIVLLLLAALPLSAGAALAQTAISIQIVCTSGTTIRIAWSDVPGATTYTVAYELQSTTLSDSGSSTGQTSPYTINPEALGSLPAGLQSSSTYAITVTTAQGSGGTGSITVSTRDASVTECIAPPPPSKKKKVKEVAPEPTPRPAVNTCQHLPADIVVTGYASFNTQCQVVDGAGVGRADLLARGLIGAVDVWNFVPNSGVEICIRGDGWIAFLDAAYAPRLLVEMPHYHRGDMTCAQVSAPGTLALLATPPAGSGTEDAHTEMAPL